MPDAVYTDTVYIPDDDGTGRQLRIFQAGDGDFHLCVTERGERINRRMVRICTGQGNSKNRDVHSGLWQAFKAAIGAGYGKE